MRSRDSIHLKEANLTAESPLVIPKALTICGKELFPIQVTTLVENTDCKTCLKLIEKRKIK